MLEPCLDTHLDLARSRVRFGAGLFETLRVQNGRPWHLDWHLERMQSGCDFLGMDSVPDRECLEAFLAKNGLCQKTPSGVLRLLAVDEHLYCWSEDFASSVNDAVEIGISQQITRFSGNRLTRFKTLSYMENLQLHQEAKSESLFEVIALNEKGQLTDGGRCNLFVIKNDQILTPFVEEGALPGVGRRALLEAGLAREGALALEDLQACQGLFLVNALRGAITVKSVREWLRCHCFQTLWQVFGKCWENRGYCWSIA